MERDIRCVVNEDRHESRRLSGEIFALYVQWKGERAREGSGGRRKRRGRVEFDESSDEAVREKEMKIGGWEKRREREKREKK